MGVKHGPWRVISICEAKSRRRRCGFSVWSRKVRLRDKLRNTDIRSELRVRGMLQYVEKVQLRWYGHVMRMPDDRLPHRLLHWRPNKTYKTSWSTMRTLDYNIKDAVQHRGSTLADVESSCLFKYLFKDIRCWRLLTDRPSGGCGLPVTLYKVQGASSTST